jgi:hypothetical protein
VLFPYHRSPPPRSRREGSDPHTVPRSTVPHSAAHTHTPRYTNATTPRAAYRTQRTPSAHVPRVRTCTLPVTYLHVGLRGTLFHGGTSSQDHCHLASLHQHGSRSSRRSSRPGADTAGD